jgi:hypothetical protein
VGRQPGIYTTWAKAKAQVDRYPHSQVQTFKSEAAAVQYLSVMAERHLSSYEGTEANNAVAEVFPAKRANHGSRRGSTGRVGNAPTPLLPPAPLPPSAPTVPAFTAAVRDTSVGTDNEVFGVSLDLTSSRHVDLLLLTAAYSTRRIPCFVPVQVQDQDPGEGGRSGGNFEAGSRHVQGGGNRGGSRRGRIIDEVEPVVRFCGVAGNLTPLQTLFASNPFLYLGREP